MLLTLCRRPPGFVCPCSCSPLQCDCMSLLWYVLHQCKCECVRVFAASTGLPRRRSEGHPVAAASRLQEVHQILDLSGPSDGAGGEP